MRVSAEIADFWRSAIKQILPEAKLYLFGSRVFDNEKGGDLDLLVLGERKLSWEELNAVKWAFFEKFGEQKVDLLSFKTDEINNFKEIALSTGILL